MSLYNFTTMSNKRIHPSRIRISKEELDKMSKDDILKNWLLQDQYIDTLESRSNDSSEHSELVSLRESEEKLKQQQLEATRRENILVMRLTTKEQEMQEYASQIQELKQAQIPSVAQLRSALLDPAVNLMFERMRKEMDSIKARLEETQNELSAWKFTPDSNTGKRLMAKCRLLYQENEELGKMISSGRMAKLEGDLALQKSFSEEMKKSQSELDEFLLELDEDVEGMQSTIYYLQQQLRESKEQIQKLKQDKQKLSDLLSSSPANHCLPADDNTDTEGDRPISPDLILQQVKESKKFHSQPLIIVNDISRTEGTPNPPPDRGTNSGRPWSPPPPYEGRTDHLKTADQKVPVDDGQDLRPVDEVEEDSHSSTEPLAPQTDANLRELACEDDITSSSLGEAPGASMTQVSLHVEGDDSTQDPVPPRTSEITYDLSSADEHSTVEDNNVIEKQINPLIRKNSIEAIKRTSENGKSRKRTRPRTPVEQSTTEEDSQELPSPKRVRQSEITEREETPEDQRASLEIDTDTEVQVAQTLAWWAAAKQERKDVHVNSQDSTSDSLGNGELKEKISSEGKV